MSQAQQPVASRESLAAKYLSVLQALAVEIDGAMGAVVRNSLPEFQDHVARQEMLCLELRSVMSALAIQTPSPRLLPQIAGDVDLAAKIVAAHRGLDQRNRCYASLLRHSGQSLALLSAVCRRFQDGLQPVSTGPTWSCEV